MAHYRFIMKMKDHGFCLDEINSMIPFERDIYVTLLNEKVNSSSGNQFNAPTEF